MARLTKMTALMVSELGMAAFELLRGKSGGDGYAKKRRRDLLNSAMRFELAEEGKEIVSQRWRVLFSTG